MKTMPPKLQSDDGRHVVIRPLAYCTEHDIARYARARQFPIIPCKLCGSQDNMQRKLIKEMLHSWEREHPGRLDSIFASLQNLVPSHMLDPRHFDFASLGAATPPRTDWLVPDRDAADADIEGTEEDVLVAAVPVDAIRRRAG